MFFWEVSFAYTCVLFVRSNLFVSDTQGTGHDDHILHGLDLSTM